MEKLQNKLRKMPTNEIIDKTIFASVMDNGFWHRWIAHGVDETFINSSKSKMVNVKGWTEILSNKAMEHSNLAKGFEKSGDAQLAEYHYGKAGIYYNLAQWVFPEPNQDRLEWYNRCLEQFNLADNVSEDKVSRHTLTIEGKKYGGRIRIPKGEKLGVVILVMPTDSTKEEFHLYEQDFAKEGYVVVSFDGTGQGETLLVNGHKADLESWEDFIKGIVEFAASKFSDLPINLFGTSSGGAWAIEGSRHPYVSKVVTVSPPPKYATNIKLPDYFRERMSNMLVDFEKGHLPSFDDVSEIKDIVVFHGGKDLLINGKELVELYDQFSSEKRFITYDEEGHCCNFKLGEIRHRSAEWFKGGDIYDI
ncbi:alpha/beta hydrolase [Aquibacillus sediminis]|uniref:alpha/beta hydrolase n=1 Tax=Aquibacillus sediminis TaxID=2574734 RepID=UPI001108AE0D|nr:alpha/beta hydrolase [Aquibacillus sediminis]